MQGYRVKAILSDMKGCDPLLKNWRETQIHRGLLHFIEILVTQLLIHPVDSWFSISELPIMCKSWKKGRSYGGT